MTDTDKREFKRMMNALMAIYYKPELSNDALRVWFGKLERYEFETVCKAFDKFSDSSVKPPEPSDIISLCQHKVTIYAKLPSPLALADNHRHAVEVKQAVSVMTSTTKDMKGWARKIIDGTFTSNAPDTAMKYAKEALNAG